MPTITTRRKMGWITITFHTFMTFCTAGLWLFVVAAGRRRRKTVTHIPG